MFLNWMSQLVFNVSWTYLHMISIPARRFSLSLFSVWIILAEASMGFSGRSCLSPQKTKKTSEILKQNITYYSLKNSFRCVNLSFFCVQIFCWVFVLLFLNCSWKKLVDRKWLFWSVIPVSRHSRCNRRIARDHT